MLDNCFRFAPRDSIPGLIAKICKYLKDHPGWSEEELEEQIKKFISATGVESFNGRTGTVTLDKNDVNNLKIASAYFAEGDESIDSLDLVSLYNQGVRFVFTDFNSVTSGYNLSFVLDYFSGSGEVVYYPMSTGSGSSGNIVSVNGKTGVVELSLADIIGTNGVQVKICTETEFTSANTATWNAYYNEGYRIIGVVNSSYTAIDYIYLLKQDGNNHTPIGLSTGASDAYTPANPPPYPVTSVNGKTGVVTGLYDQNNPPPYPVNKVNNKTGLVSLKVVDVSNGNSSDENAYIFIDEDEEYPEVVSADSEKLGGKAPEAYVQTEDVLTYEEIQASTDLTGKLPSAKALADGLLYCGAKLLWQYSSSSPQFKEGTLNVPGLSDGKLFAFFTNSGVVCVGSRYMGIGGYLKYNSTSDAVFISYRYNGSGDNLIIDNNNKGCYGSDGAQWAINQIYKLI